MNALLNGTGWGEAPTAELRYPEWMAGTYLDPVRQAENIANAKAYRARCRMQKKVRIERNRRRNRKLCLFLGLAILITLSASGTLIC